MYRVLKTPKAGGAVYAIAPVHDQTQVRHVHRTLLKAIVNVSGVCPSTPLPMESICSSESSGDEDLVVLRQEGPGEVSSSSLSRPVARTCVTLSPLWPAEVPGPSVVVPLVVNQPLLSRVVPVMSHPDSPEVEARRTTRVTAGQHSNVHHLPRPAGVMAQGTVRSLGPVSNAVSALFRPWSKILYCSIVGSTM